MFSSFISYLCSFFFFFFFFQAEDGIRDLTVTGVQTCALPITNWPAGNFFPASLDAVGFVNRTGGGYHLSATSPYRNAGTDGKDLGADIDAPNEATACALDGACTGAPPDGTPPPGSIPAPPPG